MTAGLTIHQAFAERSPAVAPMTEVSIEENRPTENQAGFDFADKNSQHSPAQMKRTPANIKSKTPNENNPYSYIGPIIFLLALPMALWIIIAKKMKQSETAEKIGYYPKTFQFKPFRTHYQKQDIDDDHQDFPKAS